MPPSMLLPLSLSLCFLLPGFALAAEPLHLDLSRRAPSGQHDMKYYAAAAEHLRGKYGLAPKPVAIKGRAAADIDMVNQQVDASYFATVNIGTPPQPFEVILDTGSSDLWVADSSCTSCSRGTPVFNAAASSSIQLSQFGTNIKYGSGEVAGQIGDDVVSMGGFTVQNQTFLAVDNLTDGLLDGRVSGILGLAFSTIASTRATPFWQALLAAGQLTAPEMGFWMTRVRGDPTAREEEFGGVFTLGGTNRSLYVGNVEYLDMPGARPTFWLLNLRTVTVQGRSVPVTQASALSAIDTGTTLIGGPTRDVQAIYAAIPGSQPVTSMRGFFSFPCTTKVSITLSFGGKSWPINPADMNLGRLATGSTQCVGGIFDLSLGSNIVSGGGNPNWVVGATFLKNVYSVYRASPPQIGFAQLSKSAGGSGETDGGLGDIETETNAPTAAPPAPSGTPGNGPSTNPPSSGGGPVRNAAVNNTPGALLLVLGAMAGLLVL